MHLWVKFHKDMQVISINNQGYAFKDWLYVVLSK